MITEDIMTFEDYQELKEELKSSRKKYDELVL